MAGSPQASTRRACPGPSVITKGASILPAHMAARTLCSLKKTVRRGGEQRLPRRPQQAVSGLERIFPRRFAGVAADRTQTSGKTAWYYCRDRAGALCCMCDAASSLAFSPSHQNDLQGEGSRYNTNTVGAYCSGSYCEQQTDTYDHRSGAARCDRCLRDAPVEQRILERCGRTDHQYTFGLEPDISRR